MYMNDSMHCTYETSKGPAAEWPLSQNAPAMLFVMLPEISCTFLFSCKNKHMKREVDFQVYSPQVIDYVSMP